VFAGDDVIRVHGFLTRQPRGILSARMRPATRIVS
jgi:hypothetical protein